MWPYPWTHMGTPSHLGHMDRVVATIPSQAHAAAAQEAPDIGQWEGQDVPLVRSSSCIVKGGISSSRRYLPIYLPFHAVTNWHISFLAFSIAVAPVFSCKIASFITRMLPAPYICALSVFRCMGTHMGAPPPPGPQASGMCMYSSSYCCVRALQKSRTATGSVHASSDVISLSSLT